MMRAVLLFGAGYVLGAKAGRERYAQIEGIAKKVGDRINASTGGAAPTSDRH